MEQFDCNTRLFFGPGALEILGQVPGERALIVTDRFFFENGTAAQIGSLLPCPQISYFCDVLPDPEVSLAAQATAQLESEKAQVLVALGGGSVLDCAKAMAYFAKTRPMLIAIPTTSGTGSEVTSFSILTHEGVKHPLVDPSLRPDWAILDDCLLKTLPASLAAETGMDLISHALEAVAAKGANPFTKALSFLALDLAMGQLPQSVEGDVSVRGEIHYASTMAGLAFDRAGLGLCHALSHALGGRFHVAHGRLNGILLPLILQFNAPAALHSYAEAARACGHGYANDQMAFRSLLQQLKQLRRRLKLPQTLTQAGISSTALSQHRSSLAQATLKDPCMTGNPILPTLAQVEALLEEAAQ